MAASPADVARAALAARVRDPGYTPGIRDLAALLELFAEDDDDLARATERAVLRIEGRHSSRLVRGQLVRSAGGVAQSTPGGGDSGSTTGVGAPD